ncbi:hypothetical protein IJJ36_04230 [Candidatus Saccharibacteria bacterium]|nr:hypothetical protein [Candidatus Saccharibacteria bacterium]
MKKSLIMGAASLAIAAIPAINTFAVGTGTQTQDVTVGEVEETVYSVDIDWGDMVFDWRYDASTNAFNFTNRLICSGVGVGAESGSSSSFDGLYQDDACTEPAEEPFAGPFYGKVPSLSTIDVEDSTVNGRIKARASFSTENGYSWVTGRFSSAVYATINADGSYSFSQDLDNGYLEALAGSEGTTSFNGILYLEGDGTHITSDSVHAGDKIGTVTLTIEPDLN